MLFVTCICFIHFSKIDETSLKTSWYTCSHTSYIVYYVSLKYLRSWAGVAAGSLDRRRNSANTQTKKTTAAAIEAEAIESQPLVDSMLNILGRSRLWSEVAPSKIYINCFMFHGCICFFLFKTGFLLIYQCNKCCTWRRPRLTRSSAIADKPRDAFRGQLRSPNMLPFHMIGMVSY